MYIDDWFQSLTQRIRAIEHEWPKATDSRKQELLSKLWELRHASDQVVDLWLQYEEKLSNAMKQITGEQERAEKEQRAAKGKLPSLPFSAETNAAGEESGELYRKGEGFYHLRLYEEARGYFRELVAKSPDWETGRLYYAYSLLFCDDKQAALREFRLLSKSALSPGVSAISCNAIGCMLAEEGKWLEARQAFCESLGHHPTQAQAMYNLALSHLHDGEPDEAMEILDTYLVNEPNDWEAHIAWLQAAKSIAAKERAWFKEAPARLQLPIRQLDPEIIHEIALFFEANGQNDRAYNCYRHLTERSGQDDWAWHGLAWNAWMIKGMQHAIPLLKKAISLAPGNLDYLFSYGWLLLFDEEASDAANVFRFVLSRNPGHHLALAGLIVATERLGEYGEAKTIANSLSMQNESYLRALGNYHLGRLAAIQEQWPIAEQFFRLAAGENETIPEAKLFLDLCLKMRSSSTEVNSKQDYCTLLTNVTIH